MTKHWSAEQMSVCLGCEYLRNYGLPKEYITVDHQFDLHQQGPDHPDPCMFCGGGPAGGPNKYPYTCLNCGEGYTTITGKVLGKCFKCGGQIEYTSGMQGENPSNVPQDIPDPDAGTDPNWMTTGMRPAPKPQKMDLNKVRFKCNECGRTFTKSIGIRTYEAKCPKCGSFDTELN